MGVLQIIIKCIVVILCVIIVLNFIQIVRSHLFAPPLSEENFFAQLEKPANIAHRGASGKYPENTMIAFEKALDKNVDALEMDVWLTADDKAVVIHDETVDRTTDGEGKVRNFTFDEIQELDAGYNFQPPNNTHSKKENFPFRGEGITIPTLNEVLNTFNNVPIIIELKKTGPHAAQAVASVIQDNESEDRVMVASMDSNTVQELRRSLPRTVSAAGTSEVIKFYIYSKLGLAGWMDWTFEGLFVPTNHQGLPVLTYPFRTAAKASGTHIHVWTINEKEEMKQLLDKEIQGILTDYPNRLNQILEKDSLK